MRALTFLEDLIAKPGWESLKVTGPDRGSWLNGLLTCDVVLEIDQGAWGLLLNKQGKIQTEVTLLNASEACYLAVMPGKSQPIAEYLEHHLIMEDAELSRPHESTAWVVLYGAKASRRFEFEIPVLAQGRVNYTEEGARAFAVEQSRVDAFIEELQALTKAPLASPAEWDRYRIRHALPCFGVDYDERHNPHDASLERRTVSWTKGCYLGQEVVCMLDMRGKAKQRIVPMRIGGALPPSAGTQVLAEDGQLAGEITSSVSEADAPFSLAMARLKRPYYDFGQRLFVDQRPTVALFGETEQREP